MSIWTTLLIGAWATIRYLFFTTVYWLSLLFVAPFQKPEILWVLVPIWINLIFTDFFQEKHSTSMGNAITNGAVAVWVGIDWVRHLISTLDGFSGLLVIKFFICLILLAFGIFVIINGIKGAKYIKVIARIREVSYLQLMFSLVIYGVVALSWKFILVVLIYAPIFYFTFELIDKYAPDLVKEDSGDGSL
ncbi:MAG: hypothetical protein KAQ83_03385 [Nanoarchaeota archaeon]|nr:hypothetical protein [Nanoarchaeota archaeon]